MKTKEQEQCTNCDASRHMHKQCNASRLELLDIMNNNKVDTLLLISANLQARIYCTFLVESFVLRAGGFFLSSSLTKPISRNLIERTFRSRDVSVLLLISNSDCPATLQRAREQTHLRAFFLLSKACATVRVETSSAKSFVAKFLRARTNQIYGLRTTRETACRRSST